MSDGRQMEWQENSMYSVQTTVYLDVSPSRAPATSCISIPPSFLLCSYSFSTAGRRPVDHETARNIFTWTSSLSFSHCLMHKVFSIKFCIGFFYCHLLHLDICFSSGFFWLLRFFLSLRLKVLCGGFWLWMYLTAILKSWRLRKCACYANDSPV